MIKEKRAEQRQEIEAVNSVKYAAECVHICTYANTHVHRKV